MQLTSGSDDYIRLRSIAMLLLWLLPAYLAYNLIWFGLKQPIGVDGGYYLMQARLVSEGKVPFLDFPSLYTPGIYYLQNLYFLVFGDSVGVVRAEILAHNLLLILVLLMVLQRLRLATRISVFLVVSVWAFVFPLYESNQFTLEPIASIFGWLGVLFALWAAFPGESSTGGVAWHRAVPSKTRFLVLVVLAGFAAGIPVFIKQIGLAFIPLVLLILLTSESRRWSAVTIAGCVSLLPLLGFFFAYPEAIGSFYEQAVVGLAAYGEKESWSLASQWQQVVHNIGITGPILAAIGISAFRIIANRRRTLPVNSLDVVILATMLPSSMFMAASFLRHYLHYYLFTIPFLLISIAYLLKNIQAVTDARRRTLIYAASAIFVLIVVYHKTDNYYRLIAKHSARDNPFAGELARGYWIRAHSPPDSAMFILPDSPQYYFLSGVRSPNEVYAFSLDTSLLDVAVQRAVPVVIVYRYPGYEKARLFESELAKRGYAVSSQFDDLLRLWKPCNGGCRPPPAPRKGQEPM